MQDTHYRNQFETRTTSGSSDIAKRKAWESRLFPEIYDDVEAKHRVKYGVLNAVNDPCATEPPESLGPRRGIMSVAKQYGQAGLRLSQSNAPGLPGAQGCALADHLLRPRLLCAGPASLLCAWT